MEILARRWMKIPSNKSDPAPHFISRALVRGVDLLAVTIQVTVHLTINDLIVWDQNYGRNRCRNLFRSAP